MPEHPRVYGENESELESTKLDLGTSPRVRGKQHPALSRHPQRRNIPACTGKTSPMLCISQKSTEHPRVYGENTDMRRNARSVDGTSPRVRGKQRTMKPVGGDEWNIPACTGKTWRHGETTPVPTEHPRVYGENDQRRLHAQHLLGTSPRVRGKRDNSKQNRGAGRNIPACTGKTFVAGLLARHGVEHPRVYGENIDLGHSCCAKAGTSPRVRGKQRCMGNLSSPYRNIPACTGKTICLRPLNT